MEGWSNIRNEPIICITLTTSSGQFFLIDTVDTSGHPHTPEYLLQLAQCYIKKCEDKSGCCVGSIVTDNAANVRKIGKLLEELTLHNIISFGCAARLLNLLAHDLENDYIKECVGFVVKYFRNKHHAGAINRQKLVSL
uniref:Putative LOC101235718 [Hydra vulgaris] n=1 Tax=Lepeophtheirus salmonis TaxID=72036 RepID=A0A0K2TQU0_LEPSM